jgi:hypothetical protein
MFFLLFVILLEMKIPLKKIGRIALLGTLGSLVLIGLTVFVISLITKPSNDREWNTDQALLPYATIAGDMVTVNNIRNFTYASTTSYVPDYYDKTFDLNTLKRVWYIVEPFRGVPGSAHTFLSFEFEGNEFISISVEIRKEKNESFNPFVGLFSQYELTYVIADERDVIKLRTNHRKDIVYLYPAKVTQEKRKELFLSMIRRANTLKDSPEFYNTVTNNCTTNIVKHINEITPNRMSSFNYQAIFPEYSDRLAYGLGLIDTDLPFEKIRGHYQINEQATKYGDDPDFSIKIRQPLDN